MTKNKTTDPARDPRGENEYPDGFTHSVLRDPMEGLTRPPLFADGRGFDSGKHLHDLTEYDEEDRDTDFDYGL